jgi:curved DNA-binding protein CbpA
MMNGKDPYVVLGVQRSASEEEVKAAYKELVKKYHPDQYQNNPLQDVANEKMAEINEAYDEIINSIRNGEASSRYSGSANFNSTEVRNLIQTGNITEADNILSRVDPARRDAEWYFLKGSVCYKRGWFNEAYDNFSRAASINPNNPEYTAAMNQLGSQRNGQMNGMPNGYYQNRNADAASCCCDLICLDSCCECMGGDLIPCC